MSTFEPSCTNPAAVLMLQGTASDVGKSVVTTALCRIFVQDGYRPAPFKSQNMALNSYVTEDGKEIGRAQGVQAEACGIEATTDMNPILIKPVKDMHSQIVVHGVPYAYMSASDYRKDFLPQAKQTVMDALNRLRDTYDIVLMEGAGSPAEINLKDRDIVNMNLAGWADAPVLLISDIDRGGVFASLVGTIELLEPHEVQRIRGFIINKFRGDLSLLQPGLDWLEKRTDIPVLGVLPYLPNIRIEAEDSVVLDKKPRLSAKDKELDIAVIRYPRISNFTDTDALAAEPDVSVRYVTEAGELGVPDAIILPGTKDTIGDLLELRARGLEEDIRQAMKAGRTQLVGICGGYQMLGTALYDPQAVESGLPQQARGLGWLALSTTFLKEKQTVRVQGTLSIHCPLLLSTASDSAFDPKPNIEGYEIHMGVTECVTGPQSSTEGTPGMEKMRSLFHIRRGDGTGFEEGWGTTDGKVWGTYLHGVFDNDCFRRSWLDGLRQAKGLTPLDSTFTVREAKEQEFDRVAEVVRAHLDMDQIYRIMGMNS
ncbi:cobyric acid synthase [Paenibacillus sp. Aloe-11]|uniref:cobyric acid synthase n=1 Tax=Paenibacillus sp. Aloe-11 TaxID=1050222 RepID=UPI00024F04D4|nr:cobyric acid synthase [Paenibacillus sp. Aloe-11]EHS58158.1 Cobyric acid synthase [Paenibacillus sp. Aloe-11]